MFVDSTHVPLAAKLEQSFQEIRHEFDQLPDEQLVPWPETNLYEFGWKTFGFVALRQRLQQNCRLCPTTAAILDSPQVVNAGFSALAAGAKILPHIGYTDTVIRVHLGIVVPEECGIRVGPETRHWEEGKVLAFDDTTEHEAWNLSGEERVVLLVDLLRPGVELEIPQDALAALDSYLQSSELSDRV